MRGNEPKQNGSGGPLRGTIIRAVQKRNYWYSNAARCFFEPWRSQPRDGHAFKAPQRHSGFRRSTRAFLRHSLSCSHASRFRQTRQIFSILQIPVPGWSKKNVPHCLVRDVFANRRIGCVLISNHRRYPGDCYSHCYCRSRRRCDVDRHRLRRNRFRRLNAAPSDALHSQPACGRRVSDRLLR
jgi:hypothetical protein